MDDEFVVIMFFIVLMGIGAAVGAFASNVSTNNSTFKDCQRYGKTVLRDKIIECKIISEDVK